MRDPDVPRLLSRGIWMEKIVDKQIAYLGCVIQIDEGRRRHTPVNSLVYFLEMLTSCLFGQRYAGIYPYGRQSDVAWDVPVSAARPATYDSAGKHDLGKVGVDS
jgi:hypothetical protein